MTDTLYDLLGALPQDASEDLRTAFRRAVKGAHPDLNPDDPDAALKFRQIVRANDILSDDQQRAVYDHLLDLARLEQQSAAGRTVASRIHRLASGTLALVGLSALTVGSYLLCMHISAASVSTPNRVETGHGSSGIVQVASEDAGNGDSRNASASSAVPPADVNAGTPAACSPAPDIYVDRNAILQGAFAELDRAIAPDLRFAAAYIDRNVIFYRPQKSNPAFADLAQPKQEASRTKLAAATARTQREAQEARTTPFSARRTADQDASRRGGF